MDTGTRPSAKKTEIWGLTGGAGAGKSTVAKIFSENGIPVIDADQIAIGLREKGGAGHDAIIGKFGTADRDKLRQTVFQNPSARKDLERILHPLIQTESLRIIQALQAPRVIYEAALLIETGRYKDLDRLIVVEAPHDLKIQRLVSRDGVDRDLAEKILKSQLSDEDRRKVATHTLVNSGTLEELRQKVLKLIP